MLARRFTIVCLLIMVFGMGLSILVADRTMHSHARGTVFLACDTVSGAGCPMPRR